MADKSIRDHSSIVTTILVHPLRISRIGSSAIVVPKKRQLRRILRIRDAQSNGETTQYARTERTSDGAATMPRRSTDGLRLRRSVERRDESTIEGDEMLLDSVLTILVSRTGMRKC